MFNPLEYPGLPTDRHGRHWHELDVEAAYVQATEPDTRGRVGAMEELQAAGALFDQRLAGWCPDSESRRAVQALGASAATRRDDLTALRWPAGLAGAGQRPGALPGTGRSLWGELVAHESAACATYYTYLGQETDRRLRQLWELHLQMELANLHTAGDLLRRYEDREPQEAVEQPADPGTGLTAALTEQQDHIDQQFRRTLAATREDRHTAFGELAWLIAVHETIEEEIVHPLTRRVDPAQHLADRLLDEEHRISEALADSARADAAADLDELDGLAVLHDMLAVHTRREEREEFPRLRAAVTAGELRDLGDLVRAAQVWAAAASAVRPGVPQAAELVRDALRPAAQQVSA